MKKYIFLLVALSLLSCWPFFKRGYFESHDGEWMVIRFSAFHQTLASGQFPVRFVDRLNNNYGYPVANFLYPLPFYLAEIPKLLGFGFVESVKIVFVLSAVSSVLAMFWALSQRFSPAASLTGAIVYLFIPYRFVDLYVRGSLGENVAFVFLPLILGSILKIAKGEKIFTFLLSFSVAGLVLSHNVITIIFLPFIVIWSYLLLGKKLLPLVRAFILGILMSTFFWLPALLDLKYVRLSQIKVSEITNHLVDPVKLFMPSWGYGPNPNSIDGMSIQIGIVTIVIITTVIFLLFKTKRDYKIISFLVVVFFALVLKNTKYTAFLWQAIPGADIIQFPWRLHALLVFITAYLAAYTIELTQKKTILAVVIVGASILSTASYIKPAAFTDKGDSFYSTNEDTTNVRDEYLPLWVTNKPDKRPAEKIEIIGAGQIISKSIESAKYSAVLKSEERTKLQVNTIYFPGWQAKVDGKDVDINYQNPNGVITFGLPQGMHEVIISYGRTPVHLAAELVSLLAILAAGAYLYRSWQKSSS